MSKVKLVIKDLGWGRSEVKFEYEGNINEWCSKKKNKKWFHKTQCISSDVIHGESHTIYYESHLKTFVDRYKDVVDEIVNI